MSRRSNGLLDTQYESYYAFYPLQGDFLDHAGGHHITNPDPALFPFKNGGVECNTSGRSLSIPIPIGKFITRMPKFELRIECLKYPTYSTYPNLFDAYHAMGFNGYNFQCASSNWDMLIGGGLYSLPKSSMPTDVWMRFILQVDYPSRKYHVSLTRITPGVDTYPVTQTRDIAQNATEGTADSFALGHCGHYTSRQWGGLIRNVGIKIQE